MSRLLHWLLVSSLLVALAAGCASDSPPTKDKEAKDAPKGKLKSPKGTVYD